MSLPIIDAAKARQLIAEGAVLVDVREADERAREHIPGTQHAPLSTLRSVEAPGAKAVIFHCRSGARTGANAARPFPGNANSFCPNTAYFSTSRR